MRILWATAPRMPEEKLRRKRILTPLPGLGRQLGESRAEIAELTAHKTIVLIEQTLKSRMVALIEVMRNDRALHDTVRWTSWSSQAFFLVSLRVALRRCCAQ